MFRPFITLLSIFAVFATAQAEFNVIDLITDHAITPMGTDNPTPRFGWKMSDSNPGKHSFQKAYQITVIDENGKKVWDSNKIKDTNSINVLYKGSPLAPCTRYEWTVTVWNKKWEQESSSSWFETGMMNQDAWDSAKWIGADDSKGATISPYYLPVFCIDYDLTMTGDTDEAGFIYGANDPRLFSADMNLFRMGNARDSAYIEIKLNTSSGKDTKLEVYRKGYHPSDITNEPLAEFKIPAVQRKNNVYHVNLTSVLGWTTLYVNNEKVGEVNINPVGRGGDYIAFPVLGDIGYKVPTGGNAVFNNVNIRNFRT